MLKGMAFSPVRVMRVEEESPYKQEAKNTTIVMASIRLFQPLFVQTLLEV